MMGGPNIGAPELSLSFSNRDSEGSPTYLLCGGILDDEADGAVSGGAGFVLGNGAELWTGDDTDEDPDDEDPEDVPTPP